MTTESKEAGHEAPAGPQVGTRFTAEEIHDAIKDAANAEMDRPALELFWSSIASGMLIGFTFLSVAFLQPIFPNAKGLATALAYPVGFVFVVLARHQLFTENTLEPVIPLLEERNRKSVLRLLRLWAIVLPSNLLGTLVIALVLAHTPVVGHGIEDALTAVASTATEGDALLVFYRAIWGGWLIALMAWLISSTRDTTAQIILVWMTTAPIAALGFKHAIAGATDAFYLAATGTTSWLDVIFRFEIPAILGNTVGGVVLVALLNHAQVKRGPKTKPKPKPKKQPRRRWRERPGRRAGATG